MTVTKPAGLDEAVSAFLPTFGMQAEQLEMMMRVARILTQKYDVVCTNPPYMGGSGMNATLSTYVKKNFPDSKSDLFACFMEKCGQLIKRNGLYAMITQHAWMFLSSYEKLREKLKMHSIVDMAHLGARAFDEIGGEVVQTTAFVSCGRRVADFKGTYVRLVDIIGEWEKEAAYRSGNHRYTAKQENFSKIPGSPVAYWVSENFVRAFEHDNLRNHVNAVKGLDTCDNDTFTRHWYEVEYKKIGFDKSDSTQTYSHKWYPYCKGGGYSKWYGFMNIVVNWENDGLILRNIRDKNGRIKSRPQNTRYYFKEGLTWSTITSYKLSLRYMNNCIFGGGGSAMFCNKDMFFYLGYINSRVAEYALSLLNPTLNFLVGDILSLPVISPYEEKKKTTESYVKENIALSKEDWDSFETSWDFEGHPLV